jgi:hypothetical protein
MGYDPIQVDEKTTEIIITFISYATCATGKDRCKDLLSSVIESYAEFCLWMKSFHLYRKSRSFSHCKEFMNGLKIKKDTARVLLIR